MDSGLLLKPALKGILILEVEGSTSASLQAKPDTADPTFLHQSKVTPF